MKIEPEFEEGDLVRVVAVNVQSIPVETIAKVTKVDHAKGRLYLNAYLDDEDPDKVVSFSVVGAHNSVLSFWLTFSQVVLHQRGGGLAPSQLAEKRHTEAMRRAARRERSYAEIMEDYGYIIDIKQVTLGEMVTRWDQVVRERSNGLVVFITSFFHDRRRPDRVHSSECPYLQKGCPANPDETSISHRCQFRWMDTITCLEGPKWVPKLPAT